MIGRFSRGITLFDLATYPFSLGDDFLPPSAKFSYNIAAGSSANEFGGGALVSQKAQNLQFPFRVRILGTSAGAVDAARRSLVRYLKVVSIETLYFEFLPYDLPEPLWGQGLYRLEVVTADVSMGLEYRDYKLRQSGITVTLSLEVKPFTNGKKQRAASATGAIWMDNIGSASGDAWGLRISSTFANKFTNPIFANLTWNTGWTAGAGLIETKNTDLAHCFPGSTASAFLTAKTTDTYLQNVTLTAATYYFMALVARPGGAAVTSSDCQLYYNGAALTTTFASLGNGVYFASASAASPDAAAHAAGVQVAAGRGIYLIGVRVDSTAYPMQIGQGDLLAWAWTGTAHASTSSCATAGRVRLDVAEDTFSYAQWSVHFVIKVDFPNTYASNRHFFNLGATNIRCYFQAADDKIVINDNTSNASTAAMTFSAFDVIEVLATGGPAGLAVYVKNHTTGTTYSGTFSTYTPPAAGSYLYIGTTDAVGSHAYGVFQSFETYGVQLTSAQAATLQTIVSGYGGAQIGRIPWLWTKDGDNIVDNCNDSTRDNFAVCGGIPGNIPAETEFYLGLDATAPTASIWIGNHTDELYWRDPSTNFWDEAGATAEAGNSRGDYFAIPGAGGTQFTETIPRTPRNISGNTHYFIRARSETGTHSLGCVAGYLTNAIASDNPSVTFSMDTSYRLWYVGSANVVSYSNITVDNYYLALYVVMDPGANSFRLDFSCYINGTLMRVDCQTYTGAAASGHIFLDPTTLTIRGREAKYSNAGHIPTIYGDIIELQPGSYNTLTNLMAASGAVHDPATTLTYTRLSVTPRWTLL